MFLRHLGLSSAEETVFTHRADAAKACPGPCVVSQSWFPLLEVGINAPGDSGQGKMRTVHDNLDKSHGST